MAPCVDSGMICLSKIPGGHLPQNRVDQSPCKTTTRPSDMLPCASVSDVGDPADVKIRKRACVGQSLAKPIAGDPGPAAASPPGLCNHPRHSPALSQEADREKKNLGNLPHRPPMRPGNHPTHRHERRTLGPGPTNTSQSRYAKYSVCSASYRTSIDTVSERLRRWTRNPLGREAQTLCPSS
jgi:hypothetical protein